MKKHSDETYTYAEFEDSGYVLAAKDAEWGRVYYEVADPSGNVVEDGFFTVFREVKNVIETVLNNVVVTGCVGNYVIL